MRDYCPSRQEQAKLKAKKVKAKKIRRSRTKQTHSFNWQKVFFLGFSLLLLVLLLVLVFYLFRNQLMKRHQLERNQHLLIMETGRAHAWVVLAPAEQKIKVFDFNLLSAANWQNEESKQEINEQEETLYYSLIFNSFVDQIIEYPSQMLSEDKQNEFKAYLIEDLKKRKANNLAFYLEVDSLTWEWSTDAGENTLAKKQQQFINFLNRNTAVSYDKLFECPVAVINSSGATGLASAFAELLEKDGFSVVKRDSGQDKLASSSLLIDPENSHCQLMVDRFQQLLPGKTITTNRELAQQYRAGAVVFLAEDLAQLRIRAVDFFHEDL